MPTRMFRWSMNITTGMTICIMNTTTQAYNSLLKERMDIRIGTSMMLPPTLTPMRRTSIMDTRMNRTPASCRSGFLPPLPAAISFLSTE